MGKPKVHLKTHNFHFKVTYFGESNSISLEDKNFYIILFVLCKDTCYDNVCYFYINVYIIKEIRRTHCIHIAFLHVYIKNVSVTTLL